MRSGTGSYRCALAASRGHLHLPDINLSHRISDEKARSPSRTPHPFPIVQSVSVEFQRGTTPVSAYYDLALSILEGDATSLLALVGKLPDEAKKTELRAHHERRIRDAAEAAAAEETAARTAEADAMAHRLDRVASLRPLAPIHRVESNSSFASSDTKDHSKAKNTEANDVMRELFTLEDDDDEDCCPVCLDAKVTVSCVPCGHSLCAGCLELWRQTNASFYAVAKNGADAVATTCPMCRAHITGFTEYVRTVPKHGAHKRRETTPNPNDGGIERRIDGDGGQESMEESNGRRKESRGARARRKKREVENAGDVDGGFGPADYRAYGDSRSSGDASSTANESDDDAPIVVWFRQDLRVRDNPALHAAARTGRPVVPCFVWCPSEDGAWPMGGASRYWAHHALQSLNAAINSRYGGAMCVRDARHARGSSFDELAAVARECGAKDVYCNRVYEPWKLARDTESARQSSTPSASGTARSTPGRCTSRGTRRPTGRTRRAGTRGTEVSVFFCEGEFIFWLSDCLPI